MSITAIQGVCHEGKIEPLEKIPYTQDKRVIIVFLDDNGNQLWDEAVAVDFIKGGSEKDSAYDKL